MYPGAQVKVRPDQPAVIMAATGETITYAELERRTNRLAHDLRGQGLNRDDHYSIFLENYPRCAEGCGGVARAGLHDTLYGDRKTPIR